MTLEPRQVGTLAIVAGSVGILFNVLHPRVPGDAGADDFVDLIVDAWPWTLLHVAIALAVVLLVITLVAFANVLVQRGAGPVAPATAVVGILSGTIVAVQLGAVDGVAIPTLVEDIRAGNEEARATLEAVVAIDLALLTLGILLLFGVALLLAGVAFLQSSMPGWLGWVFVVGGVLGLASGLIQAVDQPSTLTLDVLFRGAAGLGALGAIGAGVVLRRESDA